MGQLQLGAAMELRRCVEKELQLRDVKFQTLWKELRRKNLTKNFKFPRKFIKNLTLKVKFPARIFRKSYKLKFEKALNFYYNIYRK